MTDELTKQEREALEAWEVPPPPADLARQVLARAGVQPRRRGGGLRWLALAAGLLLALGLTWLLVPRGGVEPGRLAALERTTVELGGRGVVVAEAGARLSWEPAGRALRLRQERGDVFYRVNKGRGPFEVETAAGTVQVLGTCFRLEVIKMKASRAGVTGAALGAAAASLVLVTVYEGRVLTATPRGEREVTAGEVARMRPGDAPEVLDEGGGPHHAGGARPGDDGQAVPASTARGLVQQNLKLQAEKRDLEQKVEVLQSELAQASGSARKGRILNLDREELQGLARRCELRWDLPPLGSAPPEVDSKAVKQLGLSDAERDAVKRVFADYHRKMGTDLRKLYVEVTGDTKNAESLSPEAMMSEIHDKSPESEIKQVFQRLARERAGNQAPPTDLTQASAVERLYRLLTTAGDRVERSLGAEIGPDLARRYREVRDGFGSRSRSSHGCPK